MPKYANLSTRQSHAHVRANINTAFQDAHTTPTIQRKSILIQIGRRANLQSKTKIKKSKHKQPFHPATTKNTPKSSQQNEANTHMNKLQILFEIYKKKKKK